LWHVDAEDKLGGIMYDIRRINGKKYYNIMIVRLDKKYQGHSYVNLLYNILLEMSENGLIIEADDLNIHQGANANIYQTMGGYK